ncbi:MAG: SGNH/GDSL hydrolase family protein [Candidatus Omnitrophica bacterium]|nr:SGNH/GDSL hydrolase family protein [Candidatus Omnitrophota bacterium]
MQLKSKLYYTILIILLIAATELVLRAGEKVRKSFFKNEQAEQTYHPCEKELIELHKERKKNIILFNNYVWISPELYLFEGDKYYKPRPESTIALIMNERIEHMSMLVNDDNKRFLDEFVGMKYLKNYDEAGFRKTGNDALNGRSEDFIILMLGDSFTEGCYVNDTDTFSACIERLGLKDNLNIRVLNAGVSGYSTREEYYRFVDLAPLLDIDMVLLNYFPNDFDIVEHKVVGYWTARDPSSKIGKWFFKHFILAKVIMKAYYRYFPSPADPEKNTDIQKGWKDSLGYLKGINEICKNKGIVFVIAALPPKEQFNFKEKRYYQDKLKIFCKAENIVFLDPYDYLEGFSLDEIYLDWDPHFTKKGQREYGRFLYTKLKERIVL